MTATTPVLADPEAERRRVLRQQLGAWRARLRPEDIGATRKHGRGVPTEDPGVSQDQMAAGLEMSERNYRNLENGKAASITFAKIRQWIELLDLAPDEQILLLAMLVGVDVGALDRLPRIEELGAA